jgi:hypothetical protein
MYNRRSIGSLIDFIKDNDGINDKFRLIHLVKEEFDLTLDRSVFYNDDFAIRFSKANTKSFSNTVLSLSALQKYDSTPFFVCVVLPQSNHILIANSTCLSKVSHSSHALTIDNIKGSFNGSDILHNVAGFDNITENFEDIFSIHESFSFVENLERLVESTTGITGTGQKFQVSDEKRQIVLDAPDRALRFVSSPYFSDLNRDLEQRVKNNQSEISIAALIDNVNIRGRIIEYLITSSNSDSLRNLLVKAICDGTPIPKVITKNNLGDYVKSYPEFYTATDIKTKVMFLNSNPKGYNIDKILEFLSQEKSVYMIYFVGIDTDNNIKCLLCSMFQKDLIDATVMIHHWAGRNSRGVTQFYGNKIHDIMKNNISIIDLDQAKEFLSNLIRIE